MTASQPAGIGSGPSGEPPRDFVVELFDGLAPRYDDILRQYSLGQDLRWKDVLIRKLRPRPSERVLDLACGTGLILDRVSRVVGESNAVGADLNRPMLLELVRRRGAHPAVQADAQHLPFRSQAFDVVTAGYLLKYIRLGDFLPELARVLRPGGRFGGYDFSRPLYGTLSGTLYSIYLHRVLPVLGRAGSQKRAAWRGVFEFLPRIAESSRWESQMEDELTRAGFVDTLVVPSLGGAVSWVWARKR